MDKPVGALDCGGTTAARHTILLRCVRTPCCRTTVPSADTFADESEPSTLSSEPGVACFHTARGGAHDDEE